LTPKKVPKQLYIVFNCVTSLNPKIAPVYNKKIFAQSLKRKEAMIRRQALYKEKNIHNSRNKTVCAQIELKHYELRAFVWLKMPTKPRQSQN